MNKSNTKVLFLDIETAPNLAYVWGKWEQDVVDFNKEWYILCFAAKWLGEKEIITSSLPDFSIYKRDKTNDKGVVGRLWDLMNEADIIVAHNGDEFDIKKINSRLLFHGFTPPVPFKTIDTKKVLKKISSENSNSLNDITKHWGIGEKAETGGFATWKGCMSGDMKAWKKMLHYNKQDIRLLEAVYLKLRPWMVNHPNVNLLDERTGACPVCASKNVQRRGFNIAKVTKRQRFQCRDCGHWSSGSPIKIKKVIIR